MALICALCKTSTRSLYALPGERGAKLCAACFFSPLPTAVDPSLGSRLGECSARDGRHGER
jgi:hypothetical protein